MLGCLICLPRKLTKLIPSWIKLIPSAKKGLWKKIKGILGGMIQPLAEAEFIMGKCLLADHGNEMHVRYFEDEMKCWVDEKYVKAKLGWGSIF